jgi:hypothetical protein
MEAANRPYTISQHQLTAGMNHSSKTIDIGTADIIAYRKPF